MAYDVIFQSNAMTPVKWCVERQPAGITDPMVVRFRKWNGSRSLLNQNARWTGDGWDARRWVPKVPTVPRAILQHVEQHMRSVEAKG